MLNAMIGFLIRALISAFGLWIASQVVPGIGIGSWQSLLAAGVLLGLVNAIIRPVFFFLTLPLTILTLGLFIFFVNGAMLGLVGWLLKDVRIDGLWPAVFGALIISLVSWVASWFIGGDGKPRPAKRN
jgi:putative membrane protein